MMIVIFIICIAPGVAMIFVLWKLKCCATTLPVTTTWIDEVSVERYRPMLRLLDETELHFPGSHPIVTPSLTVQLRRQRCQISRECLQSLTTDFSRVSAALKLVMAQANYDRPDLASLLIRYQLSFAIGVLRVRAQLFLHAFRIGTVDIGTLLKVFEGMRLELRTLVPRTGDPAA
jgi:hypothetical protein